MAPNPNPQPPANNTPVIVSIRIQGSRPNEPANFADVGETVGVSAEVRDDETPVSQLQFVWSSSVGTFSGNGPTVTWQAPAATAASAPAAAVRPLPVDDDHDTAGFFEAARRGELVVRMCSGCDRVLHLPRAYCSACGSWEGRWQPVSGRGHLYSWTTVEHQVHPAYPVPFTIVLVELDDHPGVRLVGSLPGAPALAEGEAMQVRFDELDDGVVAVALGLDLDQAHAIGDVEPEGLGIARQRLAQHDQRARPPRFPPGGMDFQRHDGSRRIPDEVAVSGHDFEAVIPGPQLGVSGGTLGAGIVPFRIEGDEAIAIADPFR